MLLILNFNIHQTAFIMTSRLPNVNLISLLVLLLFFSSGLRPCLGQVPEDDPNQLVRVEFKNGDVFVGELLKESADSIDLMIESVGRVKISRSNVRHVEYLSSSYNPSLENSYHNLQATRYFFSANGFGLKKGEGYYQNTWILLNQASYGITDNFTMGVGVVPLFLVAGTPSPVWITPKISIPIKKDLFNVGAGGLFGTVVGLEGTTFGVGYGAFTLGNRDHNLNVSLGYGMADGQWGSSINMTVSGMTRLGDNFYLVSENYFVPDAGVTVLSFGGRSLFEALSLDYGLLIPAIDEFFIGIPWLSLTIPFNTND